jgi:CRISPR/Cas system-associated exonuclease Cas4 (RecB family)
MVESILDRSIQADIVASFDQGITQSEVMTRMNCPRKWYFRYVKQIKKQGAFSWALLFGDAMHQMLEAYYKYGAKDLEWLVPPFRFEEDVILSPQQHEEYEYWRGLCQVIFEQHNRIWKEFDDGITIEATEQELEYEYRGFRLRGKIDLVIRPHRNEGIFPMDHKTASDFNKGLFAGWSFRFQFLYYAWLLWKVHGIYPTGMYVNAIKKPAERRSVKSQETIVQFLKRIKHNIISEPSKYFRRERLPFDSSTLQRFETYTLNPIISQFEMVHGAAVMPWSEFVDGDVMETLMSLLLSMNTDHCHTYGRPCEYLDLCENNFEDFSQEYITSTTKHPELQK